jgi:HEAT repeat protein
MVADTLIPMDRPQRLLQKAQKYADDLEAFLFDASAAVTTLLDALPHAETALRLKMLPLIGYAGKDRALWPLFHLMMDRSQDETTRTSAALQLGLAASMSDDASAVQSALIEKLDHQDPTIRSGCALALGWEGNRQAVTPLMVRLTDPDRDVREAVIASLSSVADDTVFDSLRERLSHASLFEQRVILLNLWRFSNQHNRVEDVYLGCMKNAAAELYPDILAGLAMIPLSPEIISLYGGLLSARDARIRRQVLENLSSHRPIDNQALRMQLHRLLRDKDDRVRQAAIRIFAKTP